jgi:hypothetical protein
VLHGSTTTWLDNLAHLIGADYNNSVLIHELVRFVWELTAAFNVAVIRLGVIVAHERKYKKGSSGTREKQAR